MTDSLPRSYFVITPTQQRHVLLCLWRVHKRLGAVSLLPEITMTIEETKDNKTSIYYYHPSIHFRLIYLQTRKLESFLRSKVKSKLRIDENSFCIHTCNRDEAERGSPSTQNNTYVPRPAVYNGIIIILSTIFERISKWV